MKIKHIKDGAIAIVPRETMIDQITYLDSDPNYLRRGKELIWYHLGNAQEISGHKDRHKGSPALIIGKGPSLDNLTREMIPESCIIFACNDAVKKVVSLDLPNQIYGCQVDTTVGAVHPMGVRPIIVWNCLEFYRDNPGTLIVASLFVDRLPLIPVGALAGIAAVYLGCEPIILTGFDGAYGGSCEYAKTIGYKSTQGGVPNRFKLHKGYIESSLEGVKHEHVAITSKDQTEAFSCKLLLLQDSHPMPYEGQDSVLQAENIHTVSSASGTDTAQT